MKRATPSVLLFGVMVLAPLLTASSVQAQFVGPGGFFPNQFGPQPGFAPANPYSAFSGSNPFSPGMGGGSNFSPSLASTISPYGFFNPYNPGSASAGVGYGVALLGQADVARSYGTVIKAQEDARILRQKALQAGLDTQKQKFDLAMYIKANTPTYTQEQERIAKSTLKRIQSFSLPGEVSNGKSLNYLLDDLRKFPNKKISLEPLPISESILAHVNVSKNTFGVGLLRDGSRLNWPIAIKDLMTVNRRQELDKQVKALVDDAYRGKLDGNALRDVSNELEKLTKDLVNKCNEIQRPQYMDAKRFLLDFERSLIALQRGEARVQGEFQRFAEGGRSIQQITDYMVENGLRFGPATAEDEAAYRALHARLSRYNIEMNTAMGIDNER